MPRTRLALALVVLTLTFTVGCSQDRHHINSTQHLPATVLVLDTVADKTLWSMDVPVGQRLVYDFQYDNAAPEFLKNPNAPANRMEWWTIPSANQGNFGGYSKDNMIDSGVVELPGTPIRVEVLYRDPMSTPRPANALVSPEEAANMPAIQLELEVNPDGTIVFDGVDRKPEDIGPLFRAVYGERKLIIRGKPGTPAANMEALKSHLTRPDLVTVIIPAEEAPEEVKLDFGTE